MESFEKSFYERHRRKYRLKVECVIDENGKREKVGYHIPSRIPAQPVDVPLEQRQDFKVYSYADGVLCAVMPRVKGRNILNNFLFVKLHLEADDCFLLLFDEDRLDEVAADMKLYRRRRISEAVREKAVANLRQSRKKARLVTLLGV